MKYFNYLKYSGLVVTITANPYHWAWIPVLRFNEPIEMWHNDTVRFSILFFTIRLWIDNGDW